MRGLVVLLAVSFLFADSCLVVFDLPICGTLKACALARPVPELCGLRGLC